MNRLHHWICGSGLWRRVVERDLLPWVLEDIDLGAQALEVGPGPGITTDLLQRRVGRLTAVEIDPALADRLARRSAGRNVTVLCADATAMPLPDARFDAAVSFTMLHHVASPALQDRLLAEVARVLRPGGTFAGTDSLPSPLFRLIHAFDTLVPVDPHGFAARLEAAGFTGARVDVRSRAFRFRATRR